MSVDADTPLGGAGLVLPDAVAPTGAEGARLDGSAVPSGGAGTELRSVIESAPGAPGGVNFSRMYPCVASVIDMFIVPE